MKIRVVKMCIYTHVAPCLFFDSGSTAAVLMQRIIDKLVLMVANTTNTFNIMRLVYTQVSIVVPEHHVIMTAEHNTPFQDALNFIVN